MDEIASSEILLFKNKFYFSFSQTFSLKMFNLNIKKGQLSFYTRKNAFADAVI